MVINDWVHIELDEHMKFDRTKKETWCTFFFSAVHSAYLAANGVCGTLT